MTISIADLVKQNTHGQSEAFPLGVPHSWNWYQAGIPDGRLPPPPNFTAVEGWGQVYPEVGQPVSTTADVQIETHRRWVHIKQTNQWVLVENQSTLGLTGGHFLADFSGNTIRDAGDRSRPVGAHRSMSRPAGDSDHLWYGSRGTYTAGTVDAVDVQMDMRTTDPTAHLIAMVGADWWRDASAAFVPDHSTNPAVGVTNWIDAPTQWQTLGYYSMSTTQFEANLPPPLLGSAQSPSVVSPDTVAPAAPQITAFTPDTGTVGDKVTDASTLTLTGTAEAGSNVKLIDGTTVIGTVTASASGAWSLTTAQMSSGDHSFTATATDAAGNTSAASSPLSVTETAMATGTNLLVNGSFEASNLASYDTGRWGAFSSVPGWTAISGSAIELWNNLIGVDATNGNNFGELDYKGGQDGFYQDVKTAAGQNYDLTFDARSRPGFTSATTSMEILWNGSVVATVPPGDSWQNYDFTVVGTGGQDRLTFREVAGQGSDGLGALYDNVALVAKPANTPAASMVSAADHSISLMKQFAATSFANTSSGVSTAVTGTSTNSSPDQTLALPQH